VTRRTDRSCPVASTPCLMVLDDLRIEWARIRAREEARASVPCENCRERSLIALGGSRRCYRCTTGHAEEGDHVRSSGAGPGILRMDANAHRIANEGERVLRSIGRGDLCPQCRYGFALRVGILLSRLEVDL